MKNRESLASVKLLLLIVMLCLGSFAAFAQAPADAQNMAKQNTQNITQPQANMPCQTMRCTNATMRKAAAANAARRRAGVSQTGKVAAPVTKTQGAN